MKDRLIKVLARLASKQYQDLYMVHGTAEEYVLPEDLIEDVASLCQLATKNHYKTTFTNDEYAALKSMLIKIRGLDSDFWNVVGNNTLEHLVHKNLIWSDLRLSAEHVLNALGVSANNFSPKTIDS